MTQVQNGHMLHCNNHLTVRNLEFLHLLKDGCHTQKGQQVVLSQNKSFH